MIAPQAIPGGDNGGEADWLMEYDTQSVTASGASSLDNMQITINGVTVKTLNDKKTHVKVKVPGTAKQLKYRIDTKTGCQPEGGAIADCLPDWNADCPCTLSASNGQLHMWMLMGRARALTKSSDINLPLQSSSSSSSSGSGNSSASSTVRTLTLAEQLQLELKRACFVGSYTLRLHTDPGVKRVPAGLQPPPPGSAEYTHTPKPAFEHVPVMVHVRPNPTPHSLFVTEHGGDACHFSRDNWDRPCTVWVLPSMDTLLRTPYDVYWPTRDIVDHTQHRVTMDFFKLQVSEPGGPLLLRPALSQSAGCVELLGRSSATCASARAGRQPRR